MPSKMEQNRKKKKQDKKQFMVHVLEAAIWKISENREKRDAVELLVICFYRD